MIKEKDPCNFSLFSPSEPTEVKEMKKSWVKLLHRGGFVLGAILLVAGCATDDPEPPADRTVEKSVKTPPAAQQRVPPAEPSTDTLEKAVPPHATGDEAVSPEQKVIYRADVNLRVSRFDHVREQLEKEARKMEGYLVNGSESRGDQTLRGTLVFRIPQDRFQDFLAVLEKWAVEMPSKQINGTDVSEEYVDLESRLRAKQAVEKRLLKLMKQAEKPEDLLKITDHLSRVQEEIETIKGRIRYLDNRTAHATVTVHLEQPVALDHPTGGLWQQMTQSFVDSTVWLLNSFRRALVLLAAALPPLLILAAVGVPLWKWRLRRKSSRVHHSDED